MYLSCFVGGRRGDLTLNDVIQFVTGAEEEPALGFRLSPTLEFVEFTDSYLPTSNTCINRITLPRPTLQHPLQSTNKIHDLYDHAMATKYFGRV